MSTEAKTRVMIAGIGGASLGTEIAKSLAMAGGYETYGCDISRTAYGLYEPSFERTYLVDRDDYVASVVDACAVSGSTYLVAGGEQPMRLLATAAGELAAAGVRLASASPSVVELCSDKSKTFDVLAAHGIAVPATRIIERADDIEHVGLPCIVKPATDSGGSANVFFAVTVDEAMIYADYIKHGGGLPIAQEYVDDEEGEFTVGVLSGTDGTVFGSIALRRALDAKLSVSYRGKGGLISSGYSQGLIDHFPAICAQAEQIARALDSRGPINVQGRVRDGVLLPFEVNPRFSASTHLRAMAGFNEIDVYLRHLAGHDIEGVLSVRPGWYLRSLTEQFVPLEKVAR